MSGGRAILGKRNAEEASPKGWMYQCHILEHHASGMMAHFEVTR
jgi:FtsP/CotA-like multicopper oxidase with cupredoxin domain